MQDDTDYLKRLRNKKQKQPHNHSAEYKEVVRVMNKMIRQDLISLSAQMEYQRIKRSHSDELDKELAIMSLIHEEVCLSHIEVFIFSALLELILSSDKKGLIATMLEREKG